MNSKDIQPAFSGTSKKPKICIVNIPKDQSPHFLLINFINVTPSLPYLSLSPGLSSSTISCAKCFLSMAKNLLSAFLRFFQQKRMSMSLPMGAKSQRVWTSNGNAGYSHQRWDLHREIWRKWTRTNLKINTISSENERRFFYRNFSWQKLAPVQFCHMNIVPSEIGQVELCVIFHEVE